MSKAKYNLIKSYEKGYRIVNNEIIGKRGVIKGSVGSYGYIEFSVRIGSKSVNIPVHRLVAYQKFGDKIFEGKIVVRHLNGDCKCNFEWNIAIGSNLDNHLDRDREDVLEHALNATSYAKKHDHKAIIEYRKSGATIKDIMHKFNISSKGTVSFIINKSCDLKD